MNINRNDPCPCGSHKKYKKCCIGVELKENFKTPPTYEDKNQSRVLAVTTTGEIFQPTRIHYEVKNPTRLLAEFDNIKCLEYDPEQKRYVWLYKEEAKNLKFKHSSLHLDNPIVLGEFISKANGEMVLNTRSIERAIEGILFFNKLISKNIVQVKDITIINKLYSIAETLSIKRLDDFFDDTKTTIHDPKVFEQKLEEILSSTTDLVKRMNLYSEYINQDSMKQLPEIERFPSNYNGGRIISAKSLLNIRQLIALQHWNGNHSYTMRDAINAAVGADKK